MPRLRIGLAQVNLVVGDLDGNVERMVAVMAEAARRRCDLVAFPELAITGYPPEDLVLKDSFVSDNLVALERVATTTSGGPTAVVGFVDRHDGLLYNAAAICHEGAVAGVYRKRRLPNYAVFDEMRYFAVGSEPLELFEVAGVAVGLSICEDAWGADGPIAALGAGGAQLVVNINGSPYETGKLDRREATLATRAGECGCPIAYVNLVGAQDELVFDGASMVVGADGAVLHRAGFFVDDLLVADLDLDALAPTAPDATDPPLARRVLSSISAAIDEVPLVPEPVEVPDLVDEVYAALVLGTRDYVTKNRFSEVVIGLSGGIDSSLVAVIAADALGADRVYGVLMPSRYSSDHSLDDAEALATNLGIDHRVIPIEPAHRAFTEMLAPSFDGRDEDLTEENLQSRIRGVLLMALSNKFGWMVLTTSNKSESAVGYSTLYGDSAGGFAVIKDVPKLLVYELCRRRNELAMRDGAVAPIPEHVLTKPPSAELRPDQRDDESLPPYDELDALLEAYVEKDRTVADLIADGHDADLVRRIARLVDTAEYKRRQFPPGPRVTSKAFGRDRRLPIINGYRG